MYISFRGFMPRKSIYSGCTPCTLAAKVLPKGIIFANGFAFTGSRGTGSHCQLNRGINPLVRFYTVDASRKSTGIGLSIARVLVERMGGSIEAEYCDNRLRIIVIFE